MPSQIYRSELLPRHIHQRPSYRPRINPNHQPRCQNHGEDNRPPPTHPGPWRNIPETSHQHAKHRRVDRYQFPNTSGLRWQLGFIVVPADVQGRRNMLHNRWSRFKRATRSVIAAEINAGVFRVDNAYVVPDIVSEIT